VAAADSRSAHEIEMSGRQRYRRGAEKYGDVTIFEINEVDLICP
jgi:hypothetical protein